MLDNMNDDQIVRTIHRLSPETPVIVISFMSPSDDSIVDIKDEVFDFFQKPLNLEALKQSVKNAVSNDLLT
jgi:DNA-binding NtrC family response regulator